MHVLQYDQDMRPTIGLFNHEELLLHTAQPVQAGIGEAVFQVMGVGGHTHHVQLVFLQALGPSIVPSSFIGGLSMVGPLQGCEEWALPHGPKIMLPKWLGLAFDEGALVLPACMRATHVSCSKAQLS